MPPREGTARAGPLSASQAAHQSAFASEGTPSLVPSASAAHHSPARSWVAVPPRAALRSAARLANAASSASCCCAPSTTGVPDVQSCRRAAAVRCVGPAAKPSEW